MSTTMPTGDILGVEWKLIFADDFLGASLDTTKWFAYPDGWKDTTKHGTYMPSKVLSVHNSYLDYNLHTENGVPLVACVSPILPGIPKQKGQLYHRHSIRFKCDVANGFKYVPLLWPDSENWPTDGEIDFPEADLDKVIKGYVHYQNGTSPSDQAAFATTSPMGGVWHIADTIWTPGGVQFHLDGKIVGQSPNRVPNTPMHLDLQAETSTDGEYPAATTVAHILLDWCVVYQYVR